MTSILRGGGHSIEDGQGHGGEKGQKNREKVVTSFMDDPYLWFFSIKKSMYKSPLLIGNVHSIPFFNFHSEGFQDKIFDKIQPLIRRHCRFINVSNIHFVFKRSQFHNFSNNLSNTFMQIRHYFN